MAATASADQASRSPSPCPAPPTPTAPGPRASALQKLHSDAISHVLKTCSYANFSSCFPTPGREVPGSMQALHAQFTDKLGEQLRRNFEELCEERHVVQRLNELDGLVEEGRRRMRKAQEGGGQMAGPAHTLPPQTLYLSHLAPQLRQYSAEMKTQQDAVQAENSALLARVQQQRKDIAALVAGLENVVADLDGAVAALQPDVIEGLREEVRQVDEEMRMEH